MKIQAILPLVTYPDANSDAIAINAVAVAAHLGADLHAFSLIADIPDVSNALSRLLLKLPELIKHAEGISRERSEHLLAQLREAAFKQSVNLETQSASAAPVFLGEVAATRARYFDIVLLGWEAGNPSSRACAEALVFGAARPVIILPELTTIGTIDHVAIAWDGSRVAARAVLDAMPLLERASKVSVLTVVDEKPLNQDNIAEREVAALRKRGLPAESYAIKAGDDPIGVSIQQHAIERGAKLLVMGGYGHSRVRDFVLGGATRNVLDDLRLPVLFSH